VSCHDTTSIFLKSPTGLACCRRCWGSSWGGGATPWRRCGRCSTAPWRMCATASSSGPTPSSRYLQTLEYLHCSPVVLTACPDGQLYRHEVLQLDRRLLAHKSVPVAIPFCGDRWLKGCLLACRRRSWATSRSQMTWITQASCNNMRMPLPVMCRRRRRLRVSRTCSTQRRTSPRCLSPHNAYQETCQWCKRTFWS
jgi:hypothetical protein